MVDVQQLSKEFTQSVKGLARWSVQLAGAALGATAEVLKDLEKELRSAGDKLSSSKGPSDSSQS